MQHVAQEVAIWTESMVEAIQEPWSYMWADFGRSIENAYVFQLDEKGKLGVYTYVNGLYSHCVERQEINKLKFRSKVEFEK